MLMHPAIQRGLPAWLAIVGSLGLAGTSRAGDAAPVACLDRESLRDKVHGGWIGQMVGNIQGLPFEFKYKEAPGPLPEFTPSLAVCPSDDDTDIEWVHLHAMDRLETARVPYPLLALQWVRSIHRKVWVSNERARELMGDGILPPWTSHPTLNPHARYNLSGQFCVELYGLVAPGLPRTASRLGAHYARVTVRGEPIQAASYWTALIALAFLQTSPPTDLRPLVTEALAAVDPQSQHAEMVRDVLAWHQDLPRDWRALRARVQSKYRDARGWNMNATIPNGAFVLAALLYGQGDFRQTIRLALALGYDADCNAATCGTVLGVLLGGRALQGQPGWTFPTRYENRTRDALPASESVEELVDRTVRVAERVLLEAGATRVTVGATTSFRIPRHEAAPLPLSTPQDVGEPLDLLAERLAEWASGTVTAPRSASAEHSAARGFAAIYLSRRGAAALPPGQRQALRRALDEARSDPALSPLCPSEEPPPVSR